MKVLVATDGSDLSVDAAHRAFELLGPLTDVTVLAVLTEVPGDDAGGFEGSPSRRCRNARAGRTRRRLPRR